MSLKRSRHEMMASKKLSKTPMDETEVKKTVRFQEEPTAIPTEAAAVESDEPVSTTKEELWYTRKDMVAQLDASQEPIATAIGDGFGILLRDSYEHPHISVQEYLNAFVAAEQTEQDGCWRGLEQRLDQSHREERCRARSAHVASVLAAAAATSSNKEEWETLAQLSRQSSAASKLFAMRLGRADARAARSDSHNHTGAAREIVLDHQRKEQYRRERKHNSPTHRFQGPSLAAAQQQLTPKIKA